MANKEIELQSGAKLTITSAPFVDANALLKALLKSTKGLSIGPDPMNQDIAVLKDAMIGAVTSDEVEQALFRCLQRAAYDGQKITRDLLDDPNVGDKVRADYFVIAWHVIEANCSPFFGQAFSLLRERLKTPAATPRSK